MFVLHYLLAALSNAAHLSGLKRFRLSGIFPTDFSPNMPSADSHTPIRPVAGPPPCPLFHWFVSPSSGWTRRQKGTFSLRRDVLLSRFSLTLRHLHSWKLWASRGTSCCFQYVIVESTKRAVVPLKRPVTGAAMCVAF